MWKLALRGNDTVSFGNAFAGVAEEWVVER